MDKDIIFKKEIKNGNLYISLNCSSDCVISINKSCTVTVKNGEIISIEDSEFSSQNDDLGTQSTGSIKQLDGVHLGDGRLGGKQLDGGHLGGPKIGGAS